MRRLQHVLVIIGLLGATDWAVAATAGSSVAVVGGAELPSNRTIGQNAALSPVHHRLAAALETAGVLQTLNSAGQFTVFAPTDEAFNRLPPAQQSLLQSADHAALLKLVNYHIVPGRYSGQQLVAMIRAGHGVATLTTLEGEPLRLTMNNGRVHIAGMRGAPADLVQANVAQSNGVIHVIDNVLIPGA